MEIDIKINSADESVDTYEEVIRLAGQALVEAGNIDPKYIDACIAREVDFPTGLLLADGQGIAMPHGDSDFVKKDSLSVVRTQKDVAFGRMEDKDQKVACRLVFNLALASGQQHITVLRKLIGLFQEEAFITACQSLSDEETADYIKKRLAE